MEFTSAKPAENAQTPTDLPIWKLSVNGATNAQGSGAGLILTSPEGIDIEYVLRFGFQASNKEAYKIRTRSARFTNHKGSLYKQGFVTPILKCIAGKDDDYVLRKVHEGVCGNHIGARALAKKVLR